MDTRLFIKFCLCLVIGFTAAAYVPKLYTQYTEKVAQGNNKKAENQKAPSKKTIPDYDTDPSVKPTFSEELEKELTNSGYKKVTEKDYVYACPDMAVIVKKLRDIGSFDHIFVMERGEDNPGQILYRDRADKPLYIIGPAHEFYIDLGIPSDKDKMDLGYPLVEHLLQSGFSLRNENEISDLYYDYKISSFSQNGWLYYIEVPDSSMKKIHLSCAEEAITQTQQVKDLDSIVAVTPKEHPYGPYTTMYPQGMIDNVYNISVSHLFSNGVAEYWGKVNNSWKLLSTTQDMPQCAPFEENKVGKGINCYRCLKGYNPKEHVCEQGEDSFVDY